MWGGYTVLLGWRLHTIILSNMWLMWPLSTSRLQLLGIPADLQPVFIEMRPSILPIPADNIWFLRMPLFNEHQNFGGPSVKSARAPFGWSAGTNTTCAHLAAIAIFSGHMPSLLMPPDATEFSERDEVGVKVCRSHIHPPWIFCSGLQVWEDYLFLFSTCHDGATMSSPSKRREMDVMKLWGTLTFGVKHLSNTLRHLTP